MHSSIGQNLVLEVLAVWSVGDHHTPHLVNLTVEPSRGYELGQLPGVCVCVCVSVCVFVSVCVCMCVRRESVCVHVCERGRERERVCVKMCS